MTSVVTDLRDPQPPTPTPQRGAGWKCWGINAPRKPSLGLQWDNRARVSSQDEPQGLQGNHVDRLPA